LRPTEPVVTLQLVRKAEGIDFRQLHAIADKLQPKLKRTVLAALNQLDEPAQAALMAAIESGQMDKIMAQLAGTMGDDAAGQLAAVYREVFAGAANLQGAEFNLSFDIANPRAVRWAEQNAAALVTSVNSQTRNALRDIVVRGIQDGMAPRVQAREMRSLIGLSRRDATAADNMLRGLLDTGVDEDLALRRFGRYRDKLLRARAETIARTETIRAANMGQRAAWDSAADAGMLQRDTTRMVWIATEDSRTCAICAVLDGQTVGFDESFHVTEQATGFDQEDGEFFVSGTKPVSGGPRTERTPPAHPRCRCAVGLVETTGSFGPGTAGNAGTDIHGDTPQPQPGANIVRDLADDGIRVTDRGGGGDEWGFTFNRDGLTDDIVDTFGTIDNKFVTIDWIGVNPDFQRQGIGTKVLDLLAVRNPGMPFRMASPNEKSAGLFRRWSSTRGRPFDVVAADSPGAGAADVVSESGLTIVSPAVGSKTDLIEVLR
jgi:hypothetical protein